MTRQWIAIVVLTCATVGHAGKAEAGYLFGSDLLERCESGGATGTGICNGYLAGIVDITLTYDAWGFMNKGFCIPKDVTLSQLQKVAIKGLNERPEKLHKDASSLVANIFYEAFPCD